MRQVFYYKMRQSYFKKIISYCKMHRFYYKMRQLLLCVTFYTKCFDTLTQNSSINKRFAIANALTNV